MRQAAQLAQPILRDQRTTCTAVSFDLKDPAAISKILNFPFTMDHLRSASRAPRHRYGESFAVII
jgi:hypothetical protein